MVCGFCFMFRSTVLILWVVFFFIKMETAWFQFQNKEEDGSKLLNGKCVRSVGCSLYLPYIAGEKKEVTYPSLSLVTMTQANI